LLSVRFFKAWTSPEWASTTSGIREDRNRVPGWKLDLGPTGALITPTLFSQPPSRPDGRRGRKTKNRIEAGPGVRVRNGRRGRKQPKKGLEALSLPSGRGGGGEREGWESEGQP